MKTKRKVSRGKSFDEIKNELSLHVNNKYIFREDQIRIYNGTSFDNSTNWSSKNMRRIYFSDCKFINVNFQSTGLTGSIFKNCVFYGGNFDFTIFDESFFINCTFSDNVLKATSFCKCEFINCKMVHFKLDACFFTEAIFNDFAFDDCEITDIIWENSKFKKCSFDNVLLQKLNFEFTYFEEVKFNNTKIPFASLPFVFGGIKYILETTDAVFINTSHPYYKDHRLSKEQYIKLLPELLFFYKKTANYFPVANIYFGIGNIKDGIIATIQGLKFWFGLNNYKLMYYFCNLANVYHFSISQRKELLSVIEECNSSVLLNESWNKQKQWNPQYLEMRKCLMDSQNVPYATLQFTTTINSDNYLALTKFMQTVDTLLLPDNGYHSLEVRHNSPFCLLYTIFANEQTLFDTVVGIITILGVCDQLYSNHLKDKISKKKPKVVSTDEQEQITKNVTQNVTNVTYNFYNCNINNLETDHLTRQSIGCEKPESSGNSQ